MVTGAGLSGNGRRTADRLLEGFWLEAPTAAEGLRLDQETQGDAPDSSPQSHLLGWDGGCPGRAGREAPSWEAEASACWGLRSLVPGTSHGQTPRQTRTKPHTTATHIIFPLLTWPAWLPARPAR